ncbi:siderophore-interacting protein [Prauserella rugosa]|uniref:NADPH-dependent ferric siderophore reductase n=1 Tax=Prauserella rugosa TaxID=43354 RepID=A0A660CFN5_9PSEU|nr:siderophore-interacting protein [Prauserella rugosa]KMS80875.1 side tail fiber protein [Streptomyces regensis]TWH22388.1 NADPH-dependent ferric siderophore reductase [Prauserella rugosa]
MTRVDHRHRHLDRIAEVRAGRVAEKVGYPIGIRTLEVVRTEMVGSGLIRLTLGGSGVDGFEAHVPDEHVKLIFADPDGTLRLPEPNGTMLKWPRPSPISREYTVRRFDPVARELDIDIAVHDGGLAAEWARTARIGESVHVAGPPGGLVVPTSYDKYLLAGDITALPAIARWLEEMPPTAEGWAVIEVADASEEIPLDAPAGVEVRWLHRDGAAPGTTDLIERAVRSLPVPGPSDDERLYVWLAGEAGTLKPLRRWVRDELGLSKHDHDITGYWKRGVADYDDDHGHEHDHEHHHGHGHDHPRG